MSQASFVKKNEALWRQYERMLDEFDSDYPAQPADDFPRLYRALCQHLSIARHRGYSAGVIDRLNPLVERGHALLYGSRKGRWRPLVRYIAGGFARDVRRDWLLLVIALLVFFGPFIGMIGWLHFEPEWAYHVLGEEMIVEMESMYASDNSLHDGRRADSDFMMFGLYIYNNIGIALRTFGAGMLAGVGALFILVYNGVVLGAVSGHLTNAGMGANFWPFVIGHGAFELTAIALAGQAGLKLGFAPIWPGRKSRMQSLKDQARDSLGLVAGFFVMLVIAAFIEAFWSAAALDDSIKYGVGGGLWAFVILYFVFAGRGGRFAN